MFDSVMEYWLYTSHIKISVISITEMWVNLQTAIPQSPVPQGIEKSDNLIGCFAILSKPYEN